MLLTKLHSCALCSVSLLFAYNKERFSHNVAYLKAGNRQNNKTGLFIRQSVEGFPFQNDSKPILSYQPRVPVTSCFVYTVIRDLESIDVYHPIRWIGLVHK